MKKTFSIILAAIIVVGLFFSSKMSVSAANEVEIADGCYTLISGLSNGKCLDVSGDSIHNMTNIQLWETNNTLAQMFIIKKVSDGWYSIRNLRSNKAVDVAGGVKGNGVNVQLYEWNGTDAQLWQFYDAGNGYYTIKNKLGYCLDVSGGNTSNGTNIQTYQSNGTNAQKWRLELAQGIYTFTSRLNNSKCIDVSGAGTSNGTNIQLWSVNNTVAQMFYITKQGSGWYSIRNITSEKAIDVSGGVKGNGVNVQLYDWNGTDAQLWKFISAGNGYYYIQNKLGYYLDVSGGLTSDGTNIQTYVPNGTKAQMWKAQLTDLTNLIELYVRMHYGNDLIGLEDRPFINDKYESLIYFYQNFNHNCKYDIKRENRWNDFFIDIAYPGKNGVILFHKMIITPEQLGNIIYGFIGNYLGFSNRTIFQGGGYAASGTTYLNDESRFYGDEEMDHFYISIGIRLAGTTPTMDIDISRYSWILPYAKYLL